jgi:hypothetical protein
VADPAAAADVTGNAPDIEFMGGARYTDDEGGASDSRRAGGC